MQIDSSTAGLYPLLVPVARKPAAASNANNVVSKAASAIDSAVRQRAADTRRETLPAVDVVQAREDVEGLSVGGLTRQFDSIFNRVSVEGGEGSSAQGLVQSPAQRAVAAYAEVATQEHRDELVALLGIDVFA
jgi:hypothetical protein